MLTPEEFKTITAVMRVLLLVLGVVVMMCLMMLWLWLRYGGDPGGHRPQQRAKKPPRWRGKPLSPAEWEALRQRGMSEEEIAKVDKAARWAGRSTDDDPPAT